MTIELQAILTVALLVLGRVSAFVAVLPFLSAARVPVPVRAYFALALSLSIAPILYPVVSPRAAAFDGADLIAALSVEIGLGLFLGFTVRVFFLAVSFAAEFIGQQVGYLGMFVPSITEGEMVNPFADLMILYAAVFFFVSDMHLLLVERVLASYDIVPVAVLPDGGTTITRLASTVSDVFVWALQLAAPFVLFVMTSNMLLGLANRLVPQVPVQFVLGPAVLAGGLVLSLFVLAPAMAILMQRFATLTSFQ